MSEVTQADRLTRTITLAPILANTEYPVHKTLSKKSIRKFLSDRDTYVREIKEQSEQGNGAVGRPLSLTFSIDPFVLKSLVKLQQFGAYIATLASVIDAVVRAWIEKHRDLKKDGLTAS
jgi:hypothetical protein